MSEDPIDPALLALLGHPGPVQSIAQADVDPTVISPREDGDDYLTARDALHDVLSRTLTNVDRLTQVALQSQHPRAFEVLNQLLKTAAETSQELLVIKEREQKIKGAKNDGGSIEGSKVINNTLVMTSAEMIELVKGKLIQKENINSGWDCEKSSNQPASVTSTIDGTGSSSSE